jgi:hypothetical protein
MVDAVMRRGRRRAKEQMASAAQSSAALAYAAMGWPVCAGVHPLRGAPGAPETGRACSCDRVGCPAPGAHPLSPAWQIQATVDTAVIRRWWLAKPEANVILVTGRVFDVLDVPAAAGTAALGRMERCGVATGPVAVSAGDRMMFFVATRLAADEEEWWSCHLDCEPESVTQAGGLRWHCRNSYVLAPPSRHGTGLAAYWIREPGDHPLPDVLRPLEYLVDACEETA